MARMAHGIAGVFAQQVVPLGKFISYKFKDGPTLILGGNNNGTSVL